MGTGFKAGVSGTPLLPNLTVQCEKGCTVTVSREGVTKSKTATDNNSGVTFSGLSFGTWDITVTDGTDTKQDTVELKRDTEKTVSLAKIYGIKRNIFSTEPTWERECDAVGMKAGLRLPYSLPMDTENTNDFDKCYPWSEMVSTHVSPGGYRGYADYFVKIPKFWFRRFFEGGYEHIQIADRETEGFSIHPAFLRGGEIRDFIGIFDNVKEVFGTQSPAVSLTRDAARAAAHLKREKNPDGYYGLIDISAISAIQFLILVEFASFHVQNVIGRGRVDLGSFSAGDVNTYVNTDRSGPISNETNANVFWRGIANLWGNVFSWVDGLNLIDGAYYICNDPELYADDTSQYYSLLGYQISTSLKDSYITHLGLDPKFSHILLPFLAGSGSADTFVCDCCDTGTGNLAATVGGSAISKDKCGLFSVQFRKADTVSNQIGYRLMYIPAVGENLNDT